MTLHLQVARWGNSLAMRLPADIVRRFGLREGESIEAQLTADGGLTIRPASFRRRTFAAELAATRDALPMGRPVVEEQRKQARY